MIPLLTGRLDAPLPSAPTQKMTLVPTHGMPNAKTLLAGKDEWPLPIPIVKENGQWYFDTAHGKQEILTRRIGENELDAIEVCRGFVEAQSDYGDQNRTANNVAVYAQKIISSPGQHDGLYWASKGEKDESPMGEIIARAFAEGYTNKHDPYHGYYFRVLTGQGPHASGGQMSYIENGVDDQGFRIDCLAGELRLHGNHDVRCEQGGYCLSERPGPKDSEIAGAYAAYDPDETWVPVSDTRPPAGRQIPSGVPGAAATR